MLSSYQQLNARGQHVSVGGKSAWFALCRRSAGLDLSLRRLWTTMRGNTPVASEAGVFVNLS